jgi:hypothetical protein
LRALQQSLSAGSRQAEHDFTECNDLIVHAHARALRIFSMKCFASVVMDLKSPVFAPAVRLSPTPTATHPAYPLEPWRCNRARHQDACGKGPRTAFTKRAERLSGKLSQCPHRTPWPRSLPAWLPRPAIGIWYRLHRRAVRIHPG